MGRWCCMPTWEHVTFFDRTLKLIGDTDLAVGIRTPHKERRVWRNPGTLNVGIIRLISASASTPTERGHPTPSTTSAGPARLSQSARRSAEPALHGSVPF